MNFIQKRMNKKGFTLVELIIVIAVMAILAAVVLPRMGGITTSFKIKADERVAASVSREVQIGVQTGVLAVTGTGTGTVTAVTYSTLSGGEAVPASDYNSAGVWTVFYENGPTGNIYVYLHETTNTQTSGTVAAYNAATVKAPLLAHGGPIN
jgi:type IV pilus assembly protein PilA